VTEVLSTEPDEALAALRRQLEGRSSVAASIVQDGLLALWGALPEGDSRSFVESWLTETLERTLYAAEDVGARLDALLAAGN
jgi:DNA-directed RNA polymerase specialized sigma24 family protein